MLIATACSNDRKRALSCLANKQKGSFIFCSLGGPIRFKYHQRANFYLTRAHPLNNQAFDGSCCCLFTEMPDTAKRKLCS